MITFDICDVSLPPIIKWNEECIGLERLQDIKEDEFKRFDEDRRLLIANDIKMGIVRFVKVMEARQCLHVYEYPQHIMFSKVRFSSISGLCSLKEQKDYLYECTDHPHHFALLPYFFGNAYLKMVQRRLIDDGHLSNSNLLGSLLEEDLFSQDEGVFSQLFDEDRWTERLCRCLNLSGLDCKYTANLRGKATREAWVGRYPKELSANCLLFQGAPDIVVQKPDVVMVCGLDAESSDEDEQSDNPSSQESNHSATIQMGLQLSQVKPYVHGSCIPEKAGELVAAIHLSLASRALRRYVKGKDVRFPLIGHGFQVHKLTGFIHLKVILNEVKMEVEAKSLCDGQLSASILCSCLEYLKKVMVK